MHRRELREALAARDAARSEAADASEAARRRQADLSALTLTLAAEQVGAGV